MDLGKIRNFARDLRDKTEDMERTKIKDMEKYYDLEETRSYLMEAWSKLEVR